MTLFFNLKEVEKEAKYNPPRILELLNSLKTGRILKSGLKAKLKGNSYLLNPEGLFNNKDIDILYIYQYIILASKRDYTLYKLYGIKSLPLSYYPDINLEGIRHNPLLSITKTDIHFKYEE